VPSKILFANRQNQVLFFDVAFSPRHAKRATPLPEWGKQRFGPVQFAHQQNGARKTSVRENLKINLLYKACRHVPTVCFFIISYNMGIA
jgi:hypothetical protein